MRASPDWKNINHVADLRRNYQTKKKRLYLRAATELMAIIIEARQKRAFLFLRQYLALAR